jgi:hypothetical protein
MRERVKTVLRRFLFSFPEHLFQQLLPPFPPCLLLLCSLLVWWRPVQRVLVYSTPIVELNKVFS